MVGFDAGKAVTTGTGVNTFVGSGAGDNVTIGIGNVSLGYEAKPSGSEDNYSIAIGSSAVAGASGFAVGRSASAGASGIAIGTSSTAGANELAIGSATSAITLSTGQATGSATLPIKINGVQYYIRIYTA